jgi:hypothetical protein
MKTFVFAVLLCFLALSAVDSQAICYDAKTPDHRCDRTTSENSAASAEFPIFAVEMIQIPGVVINPESQINALLSKYGATAFFEATQVDSTKQQVTGVWTTPSTSDAQRANRVLALRQVKPLHDGEIVGFAFTSSGIGVLATLAVRRINLGVAHVDDISATFVDGNQIQSELSLHLPGIPCPMNVVVDVLEQLQAMNGGAVKGRSLGQKSSYNPAEVACDSFLEPGLVALANAVIRTVADSKSAPVAATLAASLPTCIAYHDLNVVLAYERVEVDGAYFYFAASWSKDDPCEAGKTMCNCVCTDLNSDAHNCKGCGLTCQQGAVCSQSSCKCPEGQDACGSSACEPLTSQTHCGRCGHTCSSGEVCSQSGDCERVCPGVEKSCCMRDGERVCANSCAPLPLACRGTTPKPRPIRRLDP